MLTFEEEGIKQCFKIILNTRGIIINTKGIFSSSYKEVYSKPYQEIRDIKITDKFVITELLIDDNILNFNDNDIANIIRGLIVLGKSNTPKLINFIGQDIQNADINGIYLEDVNNAISSNRINKRYSSSESVPNADTSQVGMSTSATLDHIIKMRMKSMEEGEQNIGQKQNIVQANITQKPSIPPTIDGSCFSVYAYIEGKQQGPYNEKQFTNLVQYGLVDQNTPIWKEGMSQWQSAKCIPETMKFFQQSNITLPPPLPEE